MLKELKISSVAIHRMETGCACVGLANMPCAHASGCAHRKECGESREKTAVAKLKCGGLQRRQASMPPQSVVISQTETASSYA